MSNIGERISEVVTYRMLAISLFFIVIGSFALYAGFQMYSHSKKWNTFKETTGKILSKSIDLKKIASSSGPRAKYRIDIRYKYWVEGREFENDKFYSIELEGGEVALSESDADNLLNKIIDESTVYYNADNPQESFIIQNKQLPWIFLSVGFVLIIAGILIFISKILQ
ncbi:DUF3592 domain-containing protein [Leptospira sp. GIMC2001]|uniref:DUF3592 domain-containing protein n=1 Tax=Leptospira sp. GIMC2001 TaxID=1513297 RepID=UPI00234BE334|nr:DUF3592 domain-containing protein [Leptospira sp. GIMC2001]WCL49383.1 DUF3592 domain-containing protein [Leptospira sp. GIMC2001]